jgi:hypothetical protein
MHYSGNFIKGLKKKKQRKISVTIADVLAEIRTEDLPNTGLEFTAMPAR